MYLMSSKDGDNDDVIIKGEFPVAQYTRSEPDHSSKDDTDGHSREVGSEIDIHRSRSRC